MANTIKLSFSNGKVYVWNAEDVYTLRTEHRIVGSLVGSFPTKSFQVERRWLPLQLMPEEAKLLIDKGVAILCESRKKLEDPILIEKFNQQREHLITEQIPLLKERRKNDILSRADEIYEGKKRKRLQALEKEKKKQKSAGTSDACSDKQLLPDQESSLERITPENENSDSIVECEDSMEAGSPAMESASVDQIPDSLSKTEHCDTELELSKEAVIEAELARVQDVDKKFCMIQLFTEGLWKNDIPVSNWRYPSSEIEEIRYAVFKDLWEKKYYITSATKFGGDFLAYEGDPVKYHALYIVVCKPVLEIFHGYDLVLYGRLGHQVKKTVALASLNPDKTVSYLSLTWRNEIN